MAMADSAPSGAKSIRWIGFLCIFIVIFIFQCVFPAQSDDFGHHLNALESNRGFLYSYFQWNARIGEILYTGFFARFNNTIALKFLGAFIGTAFILAWFVLIFARLPLGRKDWMSICFLCFCLITLNDFAADFLWNSGWFNYLLGCLLIMLFWIPFRFFWQSVWVSKTKNLGTINVNRNFLLAVWLMLPLSFLAGMSSEQMGAWSIVIGGLTIAYARVIKVKLPIVLYISFFIFLLGYLCLYFSPAASIRTAAAAEDFISLKRFFHMSFVDAFWLVCNSFNHLYAKSFACFFVLFLLFYLHRIRARVWGYVLGIFLGVACLFITKHVAGILVYAIIFCMFMHLAKQDSKFYAFGLLFLSWVFIGLIVFQIPLGLPKRAQLGGNLILFTLLLGMFLDFSKHTRFKNLLYRIVGYGLIVSTLLCFMNWAYMGYKWHKMENYIAYKKSMGAKNVVIPISVFVGFYHSDWGIPSDKEYNWVNELYARYYGLESFVVGENPEFMAFR